jgi:hypothetical protein
VVPLVSLFFVARALHNVRALSPVAQRAHSKSIKTSHWTMQFFMMSKIFCNVGLMKARHGTGIDRYRQKEFVEV